MTGQGVGVATGVAGLSAGATILREGDPGDLFYVVSSGTVTILGKEFGPGEAFGEIAQFFERIQAGVTYANRRAGATTGAWPGINSFGGWKASGSTGRGTGGPYYVQQFMREQSRVRIR